MKSYRIRIGKDREPIGGHSVTVCRENETFCKIVRVELLSSSGLKFICDIEGIAKPLYVTDLHKMKNFIHQIQL